MQLPATLKVGGFVYSVVANDRTASAHLTSGGCLGDGDLIVRVLRVSAVFDEAQQRETLLHEALHALAHHGGLDAASAWGEREEEYVARLSHLLNMLFVDNPEMLKVWEGEAQ